MRVLNLGLDNLILDPQSRVAHRAISYSGLVEQYDVIVPDTEKKKQELSDKVTAHGTGGTNKISQLFRVCRVARRLFRKNKFDCITVQDQYYLGLVGLRLSRKYKVGLELQIHGFEKFNGLRKLIANFVIPRADVIRVVSERLKTRMISEFNVSEEKITVIPIFTEVKIKERDSKKENEKFIFLTVGRLVEIKNISLQIVVMKELIMGGEKIELHIVGSGPFEERLKEEARGLSQIKFLGWQDELEKYYKEADAYLLTSDYEGWGMVIIEAASYGLPIIMTDVGCAGEVIKNEKSGIVIPVGDKEKLKEAMKWVVKDKELSVKIGKGAQEAVLKSPNREETLKLYLKSWEKAGRVTHNT